MASQAAARKLTIADIADARAYERERATLRGHVIALKQRRRVSLGTLATLMFENRDTMRYQIQEMARVEKIFTDEGIQEELDVYNPLIPEPGNLCATLFIELTSDEQVREWLPRLVGIEQALTIHFTGADGQEHAVHCVADARHASQLTREHVTAAVHYVTFAFTPEQIAAFGDGAVLACEHPNYLESVHLASSTISELANDLAAPSV